MELNAETLCGIDAFRHLSYKDRQALVMCCRGRHYQAGQQIISHHDVNRDVFFVVSGRVRATLYSLSGKQVTFQDLGSGQMFGELSAIDAAPRSAHVMALSEAFLVSMSSRDFREALAIYPVVAEVLLKRLTTLVRYLSERVFEVCTLPVKDRIHAELLNIAREYMRDDNSAVICPAPTHADIASRIGTHREAVTRAFNDLKARGVIGRHNGALIVHDISHLAHLVNGALGKSTPSIRP